MESPVSVDTDASAHDADRNAATRAQFDFQLALVKHLSDEILEASRTSLGLKVRVGFVILIAPYVILWGLMMATKGSFEVDTSGRFWAEIGAAASCYLLLGAGCAWADSHFLNRANILRNAMVLLTTEGHGHAEDIGRHLHDPQAFKGNLTGFFGFFLLVLASVAATTSVALHLRPNTARNPREPDACLRRADPFQQGEAGTTTRSMQTPSQ